MLTLCFVVVLLLFLVSNIISSQERFVFAFTVLLFCPNHAIWFIAFMPACFFFFVVVFLAVASTSLQINSSLKGKQ